MANYKNVAHPSATAIETLLLEQGSSTAPTTGVADTYGAYVQFSADIGTTKAIYFIYMFNGAAIDEGDTIFEIAEGAAASEVVILRFSMARMGSGEYLVLPVYKKLTNNSRISIRVKDAETTLNQYHFNLMVGAQ